MALSDDFKEQLKAGNITEALALALNGAVDLKITTLVTSADSIQDTPPTKPGHRLRTRINTLEGKVENEIGDQFIGNGRYRELRQFHSDQVAQSNKIIHSNLKSLHKLFEVLIAMRSQSAMPLVLPASPQVKNQLLPPAQEIILPDTDIKEQEFAIAQGTLTNDLTQPPPLTEVSKAFLSIPAINPEALDEDEDEEEDDWDDSVLDLLESLPIGPDDQPEALDSSMEEEDWRNFIEEEESLDDPPEELDSPINQDWGILTREDFDPPQTAVEPSIEPPYAHSQEDLAQLVADEPETTPPSLDQEWEKLSLADFQSPPATAPPLQALTTEEDEDWGDLIEDEPLPQPDKQFPSLESLDLEEDEEWDDWVVESEPQQEPVVPLESLDLAADDDEDWNDFESDPFTTTPQTESKSSEDSDADWDNFAPDELEPYAGLLDLDTNVGAGFDLSGAFEGFTPAKKSPVNLNQNQQAAFQEHSVGFVPPEMPKPSDEAAKDLMDVLFGDELPNTPSNAAAPSHLVGLTEEEIFADMQFEQFLADGENFAETDSLSLEMEESDRKVVSDDSEHGVKLENDLEHPPQSVDKILPPPPPPHSHFPNQNN